MIIRTTAKFVVVMSVVLLVAGSCVQAATVTLLPASDAFGTDQPRNGVFDFFYPNSPALIMGGGTNTSSEYRGVAEFSLASIPAGSFIEFATLNLVVVSSGYDSGITQRIDGYLHGFAGNGLAEIADLSVFNPIAGPITYTSSPTEFTGPEYVTLDLAAYVQSLVSAGVPHLGLMLRAETLPRNLIVQFGSSDNGFPSNYPTLDISYLVPEPSAFVLASLALTMILLHRRTVRSAPCSAL